MAKKFKPEVNKDIMFVTSKRDGSKVSSKNAINKTFDSIGGIKKAKTYLSHAWKKFAELYTIDEEKRDVIFKEFVNVGKEKMIDGNCEDGIPSAVKAVQKDFDSEIAPTTSPVVEENTDESASGTSDTASGDGTVTDGTATEGGDVKKPDEKKPNGESDSEGVTTPVDTNPAPTTTTETEGKDVANDSENDEKDKDSENESKTTTKKKFPWFTAIISCLCGMLVAVIAIMLLGGQFSGPANRTSPDTNANSVTYEAYEFLMLDSSKSYIKLSRNTDVTLKHACRLITSPTVVTAKDGKNYLKYSHTTDDFVIEIIAPVFEDHPNMGSTRLTMEESIADRNQKFGAVEVMWNGDLAVVTLLYNGESITLNVVE